MALYFSTFIILLILGLPIAFVIGLTPFIKMLFQGGIPAVIFPQRMFAGSTIYMLMAIPFFILAGNLMNAGGLTQRLITFSQIFVGKVRGGLGMVTVIASMFFGGITGASNAEAAAIGSIMIPSMDKEGYGPDFSAALTVTASTMGPIIPPSISFVIYGVMTGESVGTLFLAGALPGILIGVFLLVATYLIARVRKYPKSEKMQSKEALHAIKDGILALIMPIIILGGILSGAFTATEAATVAVFYAFVIGFFVYRELTLKKTVDILFESAKLSASLMLIVAMASILSWALAADRIPIKLAQGLLALTDNKYMILLLMNAIMLILGMILEPTSNLIILTPIFIELARQFNIGLVHLGVIMVLNLTIGLITPPVGMCLFTACGIANISLERIVKALVPFFITMLIVLLLVTYVPWLSGFIPGLLMK